MCNNIQEEEEILEKWKNFDEFMELKLLVFLLLPYFLTIFSYLFLALKIINNFSFKGFVSSFRFVLVLLFIRAM